MDNEFLQTIVALLPFVILLLGFLVFKMNALRLSLYVWLLEIFAVVVFFICQYKNVDRVCMGEYNHLEWISCFVDRTDFWTMF